MARVLTSVGEEWGEACNEGQSRIVDHDGKLNQQDELPGLPLFCRSLTTRKACWTSAMTLLIRSTLLVVSKL